MRSKASAGEQEYDCARGGGSDADPDAMGALTERLLTPWSPDLVIGPARSEVAQQSATILGTEAIDTLQVSYWASSPKLSDKSLYPRFMRTYPTDQATAFALCDFWKTTMGCAELTPPRLHVARSHACCQTRPHRRLPLAHLAGSRMLPPSISTMPLAKVSRRVSSRPACSWDRHHCKHSKFQSSKSRDLHVES